MTKGHSLEEPHGPDPITKADPLAFQPDFLREVGEAVAAGLPPRDEEPVYLDETTDPAVFDAMWKEAGQ